MSKPRPHLYLPTNNNTDALRSYEDTNAEYHYSQCDNKKDEQLRQEQQNQQLLKQLYFLLGHEDVKNSMSYALHERVQKIISTYDQSQFLKKSNPAQQRKALGEIANNNQTFYRILDTKSQNTWLKQSKFSSKTKQNCDNRNIQRETQKINEKTIGVNDDDQYECLFPEHEHPQKASSKDHFFRRQKQNFTIIQHPGNVGYSQDDIFQKDTQNIKLRCSSKQKEQINKHSLRHAKSAKQLKGLCSKTPSKNQLKMKMRITDMSLNKRKASKTKTMGSKEKEPKQRESQASCKKLKDISTIKKQKSNGCRQIRSVNITAYTTRNNEGKEQEKHPNNSEKISRNIKRLRSESSKEKINIINSIHNVQIKNSTKKLKKHNADYFDGEKQYNFNYKNQLFQQQFPEKNAKEREIRNQKQRQMMSLQFVARIEQMQKMVKDEQFFLEQKVRSLKNQVSSQKSALEELSNSMSLMKQDIRNIGINNSFLTNKKRQNRSKLEHIWNQVKSLNSALQSSNIQNAQILANVSQEKELIHMYNTVIQQLKSQLKVQAQQRDSLKKQLKQSKKSEQAFRVKATATKDRTESMLTNVKESISKWII